MKAKLLLTKNGLAQSTTHPGRFSGEIWFFCSFSLIFQGFPGYYFPYHNQDHYLSPIGSLSQLIILFSVYFVSYFNISTFYSFVSSWLYFPHSVDPVQKDHPRCSHSDKVRFWRTLDLWLVWNRCRAWAKNIPHSKTDPLLGGVHMELMMDWNVLLWKKNMEWIE